MAIEYNVKNGIIYASISKSVRHGKKVGKVRENLGRVLDKERGIYKNRKRGVFTYDPLTNTYGTAPADFVPPKSTRRKEKLILDFGDTFMLHEFIESTGLVPVINEIGYGNPDSLWSLIYFYILSQAANCHCDSWYEGNYVRLLFPVADLRSQRISDMLVTIGDEYSYREFYRAYLKWFEENWNKDGKTNILIDSTGLPNSSRLTNTEVSNHNGDIENEVRLIYVVQKGSRIPIYMRDIPGNVVDSTTISTTLAELEAYGIDVSCCTLDAGYANYKSMKSMFGSDIRFLTRLGKECGKLYSYILDQGRNELDNPENAVLHNGRIVYVKQVEFHLNDYIDCGETEYTGYAYLCLDTSTREKAMKTAVLKAEKNNAEAVDAQENPNRRGRKPKEPKKVISATELLEKQRDTGTYILISSFEQTREEVISNYSMRDGIEKTFEIGKSEAKLLPLNVELDETLRGHLLVTFIATTIIVLLKDKLHKAGISFESACIDARNQKCKVFDSYTVPQEVRKKQSDIYKSLKIECPVKI